MTSAITPGTIDTTYPVAGQDNDSQGFRDNFTNIKTNFTRASDEITDLQNKVLLKAALTGTSSVNNNLGGNALSSAKLQDTRIAWVNYGSTSGSVSMNYSQGQYHSLSTAGSVSLSFTNIPASTTGSACFLYVRIDVTSTAHTLTLPAGVGAGDAAKSMVGIQGSAFSSPSYVITFAETGSYEFGFWTTDGGTTIFINDLSRARNVIKDTTASTSTSTGSLRVSGGAGIAGNLYVGGNMVGYDSTSEDLAPSAAASLSVRTSYFSTAGAETATLAAGTNGQIKVFAMFADSGDMVITVTNAAWGGAGTITFNDVGDACTLQYINSKWFCIGNNGCSFA